MWAEASTVAHRYQQHGRFGVQAASGRAGSSAACRSPNPTLGRAAWSRMRSPLAFVPGSRQLPHRCTVRGSSLEPALACPSRARRTFAWRRNIMTIDLLDGSVYRRCGCRDRTTGRQLSSWCPRWTDPMHGCWYFAVQISTPTGRSAGPGATGRLHHPSLRPSGRGSRCSHCRTRRPPAGRGRCSAGWGSGWHLPASAGIDQRSTRGRGMLSAGVEAAEQGQASGRPVHHCARAAIDHAGEGPPNVVRP